MDWFLASNAIINKMSMNHVAKKKKKYNLLPLHLVVQIHQAVFAPNFEDYLKKSVTSTEGLLYSVGVYIPSE